MSPSENLYYHSALQVAAKRIARLEDEELGELVGQLLRAQSHRCGAPLEEVRINTEGKAPDGGADGSSGKPAEADPWLGNAVTWWQLKAAKAGAPAALKGEVLKEMPRKILTGGGRFVLVASGSNRGVKGEEKRLETLTTEAKAAGLPTDRIVVIGSERLAEWVNQHPAIAARWANRPDGLWSLQDWPTQEHQAPWQASDSLASELAEYRQALDPTVPSNNPCLHLHLHGPPGSGKTRLAFELCSQAPWADFVVYLQKARESNVLCLLTQAASEKGVRFVVVADEIPDDLLKPLRDALEPSEGRIRLITLGTCHSPEPRRIRGLEIPLLAEDGLKQLVCCWYPAMASDHARIQTVVELANGNPRLARLASHALDQDPALTPNALRERPEISHFLERISWHKIRQWDQSREPNNLISLFQALHEGSLLLEEVEIPENVFNPGRKPIASISVISLIVQARDTKCGKPDGVPLLDLIPEVQCWNDTARIDDNHEFKQFNLMPRANIPLMPETTSSNGSVAEDSLAGCIFEWHEAAEEFAENIRERRGIDLPTIIVELFLPHDLIVGIDLECLQIPRNSSRRGTEKKSTESLASRLNLVVRSLDRAEAVLNTKKRTKLHNSLRRRLDNKNANRGVLVINKPPPAYSDNSAEEWQEDLFRLADNDFTAACFYLADRPSEKMRMIDLLVDLIDSHLPLTLLWPITFSAPMKKRLKLAQEILARIGQQAAPDVAPGRSFFTQIPTCLSNMRLDTVACIRRDIMFTQDRELAEAAKRAILVMDVPDRWPRKMPGSIRDHPEDRCIPPIQI